ncbi:2-oxoglutarate dehydrogenase [Purpureocillium lavendulum]|uniref:2-oxoglutarate dehydrogenase n=1 Tax=Purpureocillium lavendulum TaxID=1247861 RepID=A0AB34G2Z2_9HYPO|nr:2-oxoglutarate dehydrogenase [Purpureocillium lavendulum]
MGAWALPRELCLIIADSCEDLRDVSALARTSWHWYMTLNTYLYDRDIKHHGSLALAWASRQGRDETARMALQAGADVAYSPDLHGGPLHLAAMHGHETTLRLLLEQEGADPDQRSIPGGRTPLSWAAECGEARIVSLLLATGLVDPDARSLASEQTPLSHAAENGHLEVVEQLLTHGYVDVDARSLPLRRTALSCAAERGYLGVVHALLTHGADPASRSQPLWQTPLCATKQDLQDGMDAALRAAVGMGQAACAEYLIGSGKVNINVLCQDYDEIRGRHHERGVDSGLPWFECVESLISRNHFTIADALLAISEVKQACDACHARKVRCDGARPCAGCEAQALACTYLAVPKKTGPKSGRRVARSQAVLRSATERRPYAVPLSRCAPGNGAATTALSLCHGGGGRRDDASPASPPRSDDHAHTRSSTFRPSTEVTRGVMRRCMGAFFTHKYPITPILDRKSIDAALSKPVLAPDEYALIVACCAVIVLSPEIIVPSVAELPWSPCSSSTPSPTSSSSTSPTGEATQATPTLPSAEHFLAEASRARQFCNHIANPSLKDVQTSFFLFAAHFCMGRDNPAWFHLREAMTILQVLRLHEESTYKTMSDHTMAVYARRVFWVLFVTERAYALQRHRPLTLQNTIELPALDDGPDCQILPGLLDLIALFQNFDSDFVSVWNLSGTFAAASPSYLARLQRVLDFALPRVADRASMQQADLLISKQWLKVIVWQLCVTKTLLSTMSSDDSMSLCYPVTIARHVVGIAHSLPPQALEANGVGILEKVFDIACSLADVLALRPAVVTQGGAMEVGPVEHLLELVRIVGTVLGGSSRHQRLLNEKVKECFNAGIGNDRALLAWEDVEADEEHPDQRTPRRLTISSTNSFND